MGYSEIPCKLCGVSFNINRIRRPDEPYHAAWNFCEGHPADEHRQINFIVDRSRLDRFKCSTGCSDRLRRFILKIEDTEVENDSEYIDEDETESELLEYTSDEDAADGNHIKNDDDDDDEIEADDGEEHYSVLARLTANDDFEEFQSSNKGDHTFEDAHGASCRSECRDSDPIHECNDKNHGHRCTANHLEHLAGPSCTNHSGYSGHRISAEEMRGCTTSQCLVKKPSDWVPEADDKGFELDSNYFLSGLGSYMPSRDDANTKFDPHRHGKTTGYINLDTIIWPHEEERDKPVPFHPTCFEIFTRASRKAFGYVDINGLMKWRNLESDYETDSAFPRHAAVQKGSEQSWHHEQGDEWLSANPVLIPGLEDLLLSSIQDVAVQADHASAGRNIHNVSAQFSEDPFEKLPREIADSILHFLDPLDVASLRLASLAQYLPISDWEAKLEDEMPWLWEIRDNEALSIWVEVSHHEIISAVRKMEQAFEDFQSQQLLYTAVIHEEMPEIWDAWLQDNPWLNEKPSSDWRMYLSPDSFALKSHRSLHQKDINWCRVYYEIKKRWNEFKGLQNRQRIWVDIEEILNRITKYRNYTG